MFKTYYLRILIRGVQSKHYKAYTTKPENIIKAIKSICPNLDSNPQFVAYSKHATYISITHNLYVRGSYIHFVQRSLIDRNMYDKQFLNLDRDELEWIFKMNCL